MIWEDKLKLAVLKNNPEYAYAEILPGLSWDLRRTLVVRLWRNKECFDAGDPCRAEVSGLPLEKPEWYQEAGCNGFTEEHAE